MRQLPASQEEGLGQNLNLELPVSRNVRKCLLVNVSVWYFVMAALED